MKRKILATVALACLFAYAPQPAHADVIGEAITKFSDLVSSNSKAVKIGCEKANFLGGKFSVRSLEGNFCRHPVVAAWALKNCPTAVDDFMPGPKNLEGAKCKRIAEETLNSAKAKDPTLAGAEDPGLALTQHIGKLSKSIQTKLCANPANGGAALQKACSVIAR
ncbi:MAG: hypothetical protein ACRYGR_07715 [Janthinobacterium lividum]